MHDNNFNDYQQLLDGQEEHEKSDLTEYDAVFANEPDPLDKFAVQVCEERSSATINSSVEWLKNTTAETIVEQNREKQKHKIAEEIGISEEKFNLADVCGLLKTGDPNPNITIPDGFAASKLGRFAKEVSDSVQFPYGTTMLTAMSCFSAAASLCFAVEYPDGTPLPLGLYVCASQPPGTGKSRVMNIFSSELNVQIGKQMRRAQEENEQQGKNGEFHPLPSPIMSNATPEAVEMSMAKAESGRFVILSTEQGAIDRILNIGVKDRATDNDIVLKGFVGETHGSARVNRIGFHGEVFGTMALISQPGTATKIIQSSNGMGIAERFMFGEEPSLLGQRIKRPPTLKKESKNSYNQRVKAITDRYAAVGSRGLDQLTGLRLCEKGYDFIYDLHDIREPKLKYYNDSGAHMMTGALSKVDQQIMKLAAVMHIYESIQKGGNVPTTVDYFWVQQSTYLAFEMLSKLEDLLVSQGEIGEESKELLILSKFERTPKLTERELCDRLKNSKKFAGRADARATIERMVKEGQLRVQGKSLVKA